jgi:hypothetical protein
MENYSAGRFLFAPFRDSVPQGVSANLCEAIATSYEDSAESPLTVSVTWSYVVTATEDLPTASVRFEPELMPYIREAGREFRRTNPMTVTVRGWVNLMGREGRSGPGSIRLVTRVEGSARTLRVDLPEEAYRLALQAHSEGLLIQITGEFVENLNRYRLDNPRDLFVVHDTDLFSQDVI